MFFNIFLFLYSANPIVYLDPDSLVFLAATSNAWFSRVISTLQSGKYVLDMSCKTVNPEELKKAILAPREKCLPRYLNCLSGIRSLQGCFTTQIILSSEQFDGLPEETRQRLRLCGGQVSIRKSLQSSFLDLSSFERKSVWQFWDSNMSFRRKLLEIVGGVGTACLTGLGSATNGVPNFYISSEQTGPHNNTGAQDDD